MIIEQQKADEVVICLGKTLNVTNSFELKEKCQRLIKEGCCCITLDFSQVCMIDASGLGKILMLQRKIREQKGELRIINAHNKYIQKTFHLVQLEKVVNIG